jgi:hypothetical protein
MQTRQILPDPSLPPVPPPDAWFQPSPECECERPIPEERAERRGASRTHCARCGQPIRIRWHR